MPKKDDCAAFKYIFVYYYIEMDQVASLLAGFRFFTTHQVGYIDKRG